MQFLRGDTTDPEGMSSRNKRLCARVGCCDSTRELTLACRCGLGHLYAAAMALSTAVSILCCIGQCPWRRRHPRAGSQRSCPHHVRILFQRRHFADACKAMPVVVQHLRAGLRDSHRASSDTNSYSFCTCGNPQCRHYAVSGQATVLRVAAESVWSIAACATPRPCARVVSALCAFSAFSGGLRVYLLRAHLRASEALCL